MPYPLFVTLVDFSVDNPQEIGVVTVLLLFIIWLIAGPARGWWVWGREHKRLEKRLEKTEQRLRIMEALAMRGTDIASELVERREREQDENDD